MFVRWDNLKIESDSGAVPGAPGGPGREQPLPGYGDPAVVRRFDAPEALDMRFYEVRAKSVLNKVPEQSQMPFRWTVNPYRGCSHACTYCLDPATPVRLADGAERAIGELVVGDRVVGTTHGPGGRHLVTTTVEAVWETLREAWQVTLEDGRTLVASADHRFLTPAGHRYVAGDAAQRPTLAVGHVLVAADALPATAPGSRADFHQGRMHAMAATALGGARRIHPSQWGWPDEPSLEWRRGYLAGALKPAPGGRKVVARLPDDRALAEAVRSLELFGFHARLSAAAAPTGLRTLALEGDAGERARLASVVSRPARAGGLRGTGRAHEPTRVTAIEPLGRLLPMVDITTGTSDFVAAGVISHNCFARPTHTYLDMDAGRDFEREIVVKVNAPEVLAAQLRKPRWAREHVAMGTNTDPYQWVESRYRLMPGIWAALRDTRTPCSVLTKSPLLLRDVELMREVAAVTEIHANLSVPTLDRAAWRASEPHTPHPRARLEAVAELNRQGIPTGVLVAPLMPGINDDPRQVEEVLQAAADAGARGVSGIGLHLRGEVRGVFMDWMRSYRPDLVAHYEDLYARGAYLPTDERRRMTDMLSRTPPGAPWIGAGRIPGFRREDGSGDPADGAGDRTLRGVAPARRPGPRTGAPLRPAEVQTALF